MVYGRILDEVATKTNHKYKNMTGRKIKEIRESKGLSAYRLEKILESNGIHIRRLRDIETGIRTLNDISLYYIAKTLNAKIDDLFDPENEYAWYTKGIHDEECIEEVARFNHEYKNITGPKIKEFRLEQGLKQAQLQRKLELEGVYIRSLGLTYIERQMRIVTDIELYYFSKVLNKPIDKFYDFKLL